MVREFRLLAASARAGTTKNALDWQRWFRLCWRDAVLVDSISVSRAAARILPDGEVVEAGLDLHLDIALDQLAQAIALSSDVAAVLG